MPLHALDEPARLYVGSDPIQSGTLRDMARAWKNLPAGQSKEGAHITMIYVSVDLLGAGQVGTFSADQMRRLAAEL